MTIPWYFPGTMFLVFILVSLVFLVLMYWKANVFLRNNQREQMESDVDIQESDEEIDEIEQMKPSTKMREIASIKTEDSSVEKQAKEGFEIIDLYSMEVLMTYIKEKNHLSCRIQNIVGISNLKNRNTNKFRFHATILPSKKLKSRTAYRSLEELAIQLVVGINNVNLEILKVSTLRLRLYGRHFELGVPVTKEKCLGETNIVLAKYLSELEKGKEAATKQAISPIAEQFPSPRDPFTLDD
ncbi:uncharacterized protein LOC135692179 [Rhopilema esculentum]|uniref:uncharacterized protein LOC135692179 n=1 Tax=Rhopilema esculentum TaxID=499914 RepID=UPI0031CFD075